MPQRSYDTWTAWLAYVTGPSELADAERASRQRDERFTSTKTWDDALRLARHGWREGAAMTRAYAQALTTRIVGRVEREDLVYDVEGMGYDVARLLDGAPEHWQRWQPTGDSEDRAGNRLIRVLMNASVSCGVPTRTIVARGAACCALVELLEYAGARVQLDVTWPCTGYSISEVLTHLVCVKRFAAPLDMSTVAFAVAHPSALRRLVFSAQEREAAAVRSAYGVPKGGYGIPAEVPPAERGKGTLYVPCASTADGDWNDANATERWVLEQLRTQGVTVTDAR